MALAKQISIIGITDVTFKPTGATSSTDIYGIEELSVDFDGTVQLVEGDDMVIAYHSIKKGAKVSVKNAILDIKALAALTGDTVADAGTSPNQTSTLTFKNTTTPYGILEGQGTIIELPQGITDSKPADVHFKFPVFKIDATSLKISVAIGKAQGFNFSGYAIPDSTGAFFIIVFNETATPIT